MSARDRAGPPACAHATRSHPLLRAWIDPAASLPGLDQLERRRRRAHEEDGIGRPVIVAQTRDLLDDGLHYEMRVAARSVLATRDGDAHDAFNALVWLRHPQLKWALNARQAADVARVGAKQRTRAQCALTHFDEAGAIVWLASPRLLAAWDAHDWNALFVGGQQAWGDELAVTVFGHALLEHVWNGHASPTAKCLVVEVDRAALRPRVGEAAIVARWPPEEARLAEAIRAGRLLADPQELRPLPLAGIRGWHEPGSTARLVAQGACFRPLREGRRYPAPWLSR
ncbi:DUF3025 domain-containing protein [Dokdonella fugitiva]|uniref:DUF3025 family protein n=1 Tax=Dokdonella fugitiva TaxID=328517 RepID=A0A4R2ICU3_9GAMM|nr:DUF3025 domain-containing protein [Dokdonella fugitiva]TCO40415.1 DUF3025 family protein [Dokdonella fugitiva]